MPGPPDETFEAGYFRAHPALKEKILADPAFQAWHRELGAPIPDYPVVAYVVDGDVIVDEDQALFLWAYNNGWIPDPAE